MEGDSMADAVVAWEGLEDGLAVRVNNEHLTLGWVERAVGQATCQSKPQPKTTRHWEEFMLPVVAAPKVVQAGKIVFTIVWKAQCGYNKAARSAKKPKGSKAGQKPRSSLTHTLGNRTAALLNK